MALTFNDLVFKEVRNNHFQAVQQFGQYKLSVILEERKTLYEVAIFEGDNFVQLPGIHGIPEDEDDYIDDVIPYLSPEAVTGIMKKLSFIETFSKEVDK